MSALQSVILVFYKNVFVSYYLLSFRFVNMGVASGPCYPLILHRH